MDESEDEREQNQTLKYDESQDKPKQIVSHEVDAESLQNESYVSLSY